MNSRNWKTCLVTFTVALAVPMSIYAQTSGAKLSYRITPPLRVAARPVDGLAPRGVTRSDPFRPREKREEPATLAVQGYCLVSLRDQQQWVPGSPQIQALIGGKVYLFASSRARDIFLAAPHLYLPVLDGDCLVTFAETGKRVMGQLDCGLIYGKRVYFFGDLDHLRTFQSAPEEYSNADLVDNGACVVTKLAEKRIVQGIPETVAMVDGRRYFFASTFQRQIFTQNPEPFLVQPLRNPQAISKLEVPAFADVLDIESGNFGTIDATQIAGPSPLATAKRIADPLQSAKSSAMEGANDYEEFMLNRAMSGYCPVTIRTQNTWRRGKAKFRHTFDGKIYYLGGSEELAVFQANPRLYAPVLSGDSVVALATSYERVAGSVFHALIYSERLYLFVNEEERAAFRNSPAQFENADLAAQGNCLVSRIDDKQEVVGAADFETLYRGKRYRFVSDDYLQKFLASPKLYAEE